MLNIEESSGTSYTPYTHLITPLLTSIQPALLLSSRSLPPSDCDLGLLLGRYRRRRPTSTLKRKMICPKPRRTRKPTTPSLRPPSLMMSFHAQAALEPHAQTATPLSRTTRRQLAEVRRQLHTLRSGRIRNQRSLVENHSIPDRSPILMELPNMVKVLSRRPLTFQAMDWSLKLLK